MAIKSLVSWSVFAVIAAAGAQAQAGITRGCFLSEHEKPVAMSVISRDGQALLEVVAQRALYTCELGASKALGVRAQVRGLNGASVPNGGYLDGTYTALAQDGTPLERRELEGGFFLVQANAFDGSTGTLRVEVEGFEAFEIQIP